MFGKCKGREQYGQNQKNAKEDSEICRQSRCTGIRVVLSSCSMRLFMHFYF